MMSKTAPEAAYVVVNKLCSFLKEVVTIESPGPERLDARLGRMAGSAAGTRLIWLVGKIMCGYSSSSIQ
jgi:hypothetical protein